LNLLYLPRKTNDRTCKPSDLCCHLQYALTILYSSLLLNLFTSQNLDSALNTLISLIADISRQTYYGKVKTVTAGMFPEAENAFTALGLRFDDFLVIVNAALQGGITDTAAWTKLAQGFIYAGSVAAYVRIPYLLLKERAVQ
jgi:hypothetical protein